MLLFVALPFLLFCSVGNHVISAYDVWRISAHRFAISVPNLVRDLGLIFSYHTYFLMFFNAN